jgi:SpoVK/Ycf46/Vps4 family AAA+-type ATPase
MIPPRDGALGRIEQHSYLAGSEMPTTRQLTQLFNAIALKDSDKAAAIAMELCDAEESKGHRKAARALRSALTNFRGGVRDTRASRSVSVETSGFLSPALKLVKPEVELNQVELEAGTRAELEAVVLEWKYAAQLRAKGIAPRSKLLFHGPPGCGKSITAQALARRLGLPLYIVRFDAVIGAFLGQTAIHLRQIFHFAETTPSVLLLDELDALGKKRGNPLDVGELDRIVISLLQELEHSRPLGVIVGTTNLAKHLDDALWRRFDLELSFARPNAARLRKFVAGIAKKRQLKLSRAQAGRAERATSYAAAESIVLAEARKEILRRVGAK